MDFMHTHTVVQVHTYMEILSALRNENRTLRSELSVQKTFVKKLQAAVISADLIIENVRQQDFSPCAHNSVSLEILDTKSSSLYFCFGSFFLVDHRPLLHMLPKCDVVVPSALDHVFLICVQLEMEVMMQDSEGNSVPMSESMIAWAVCRQGESDQMVFSLSFSLQIIYDHE